MFRPLRTNLFRLALNWRNTRPQGKDPVNDDEKRYAAKGYIANYRKGLTTRDGLVDPREYQAFLQALSSGNYSGLKARGLTDPLGADYYDTAGPEASCFSIGRGAPSFSSSELAGDMLQLYGLSLVRDVPFADFASSPLFLRVAALLSTEPSKLFRIEGGNFVSQLLSFTPMKTLKKRDYLLTHSEYDQVHSGLAVIPAPAEIYEQDKRLPATFRDLAAYTHYDYHSQPYHEACLWLLANHRPALLNPYKDRAYKGFLAFNTPFVLDLINRAATTALRAAWYHKWRVHRQLRPEEFGYEVDRLYSGRVTRYEGAPAPELFASELLTLVQAKQGNVLLSSAFPEGCPTHPAFPAGHSTIAGACATIMKGLFREDYELAGSRLGSEINKLAHNIAMGRCAAGVHFQSDNEAGLLLGEKLGLTLLAEARQGLRTGVGKEFRFAVKRFDGRVVEV